jgi:hypothetical protein
MHRVHDPNLPGPIAALPTGQAALKVADLENPPQTEEFARSLECRN